MKMPPLLLAGSMLFWGWQSGHWLAALLLAPLVEGWRWMSTRWSLEEKDFQRIADVSSVVFIALVFIEFNDDVVGGFYKVLQWSPLVLAPLLLAQCYSARASVPVSALFASLRRVRGTPPEVRHTHFDIGGAFAMACWIAASVGEQRAPGFLLGLALLIAWLLWPRQQRAVSVLTWIAFAAAGVAMGVALQSLLYDVQERAESWAVQWLQDADPSAVSPDRAFTAIGMLGRLKFSDRIQLRVRTEAPLTEPLLLREASYSEYRYGTWRTVDPARTAIDPEADGHTWKLGERRSPAVRATVTEFFNSDLSVLALPPETVSIRSDGIIGVQRNGYGTVLVDARPGFVSYEAEYARAGIADPPPLAADLKVPESYAQTFTKLDAEIGADRESAAATVDSVKKFFNDKFGYSLVRKAGSPWRQPLQDFLLASRSGHCEYFASATALLLRHYGIPARYSVGYSVSEYSPLNGQYIARRRDAHAWVTAWVNGGWRVVDTTPAQWRVREDEVSSRWSAVSDLGEWIRFQWSHWRASAGGAQEWLPWLLPLLVALLLWRLRRTRMSSAGPRPAPGTSILGAGADSEFLSLLGSSDMPPAAGETICAWTERLIEAQPPLAAALRELLQLHCRLRFDPRGLTTTDRHRLREGVSALLSLSSRTNVRDLSGRVGSGIG